MTNYTDVQSREYQNIDVNTYVGVSLVCLGGGFCAMGEINFHPLGICMSFLSVLFRSLRIGQQSLLLSTKGQGGQCQQKSGDDRLVDPSVNSEESIAEKGVKSLIIQESLSILYYSCKLDALFCF